MIIEQQLHILIGCADARDLNQLQVEAVGHTIARYLEKKIKVDVRVIRAAGSFVTPDVVADIKRTIESHQRNEQQYNVPVKYFVHIQSHGHLTDESSDEYISHVYDLKIVDGSPLNCGMLGATSVGIEIEQLILNEKLKVNFNGTKHLIDTDIELRMLLKEVYAHDGYLAGDWIKSIDLLRTHPRSQRVVLENVIKTDPDLKTLNIKITSGIQDYSIHALIRVDGGDPSAPFWDDMNKYIRDSGQYQKENQKVLMKQSEKQKPLAGLLSMVDPKMSSRLLAAEYYLKSKGVNTRNTYIPNTIFNMTGSAFDVPFTPFGPYVIAGFYYSVKYLHLFDQMIMGYDDAQTGRMIQKIKNDPIMNLVVEKFKVNLIPINMVDLK